MDHEYASNEASSSVAGLVTAGPCGRVPSRDDGSAVGHATDGRVGHGVQAVSCKPSLLDRLEEARWAINTLVERYDDLPNPIAQSHFAWDLLNELDAVCKDVVRLRNDLIGGLD